ncbi:MAG: GntR family transcriptional regulator [Pseudomonadota bacterium]
MRADVQDYLATTEDLVARAIPTPDTLPEQIAAVVRQRVQFGQHRPGEPLRELALAAEFGVSRGPIREALRLLERENLVRIRGRAGATVVSWTPAELESHFRIRAEISALYMQLAAARTQKPPVMLSAIEAGASLLGEIARDEAAELTDYLQARRRLAQVIGVLAAAPYVTGLSARLEREVALLWAPMLSKPRQKASAEIWRRIARAIARSDEATAAAEGRRIVLDAMAEALRLQISAARVV